MAAKDKKINELPGITQAAVMGLSRSGIVTLNDLVSAEFDKVAYLLEDYNEATRLVTEARRIVEFQQSKRSRNNNANNHAQPPSQPPPEIPAPLAQKVVESNQPDPRQPESRDPRMSDPRLNDPTRFARPQLLRIPAPPPTDTPLQHAMAIATRGLNLSDTANDESRAILAKRLSVAGLLLRYGASGADVIAALILEPAESGVISADEVASRFGPKVERTLEECASLRAVPMLPSGKLPRYYLDMARAAPLSARRVCAAFLPYLTEGSFGGGGVSASAYARLLCEALEAGGHDELIAACRNAMSPGARAAA